MSYLVPKGRLEYDAAIAESQEILEMNPLATSAYLFLGSAYEPKAALAQALDAFQKGSSNAWPGRWGPPVRGVCARQWGTGARHFGC